MNTTTSAIDSVLLAAPYELNIDCVALADFLYYNFVLLTRVLQKGFQIPITNRYDIICKLRTFVSIWGNQIGFTCFTFATIDRLLSTQRENKYRQWSNRVSLAYKLTIASLIIWFLITAHRLVLYSIINGSCSPLPGVYADFDNYLEVLVIGIFPPIIMSVLAYLLIKSVRSVINRRQTNPPTIVHRTLLQQMDAQLTLMLILQSIITIVTYVPYATQTIYANVTNYWTKSTLRIAQEKVFTELIHLMSYVFFATSFYVSMISSSGFRRQMKKFFQRQREVSTTGNT